MKRLTALLASIAIIALGVGTASATDGSANALAPTASTIDWGRCADKLLRDAGAQCAMVDVPLDYDDPTGPQIQLAISRVEHTVPDDTYQGVMLVNPGGPGGSGLIYSILGQLIPHHVGTAYDWIGFDPRGVGSSVPALSCIPKYFHGDRPPYVPETDELLAQWLARSERYADACAANAPELLPHMTTIDAARDIDSIRKRSASTRSATTASRTART